jgi:hypothetical protein
MPLMNRRYITLNMTISANIIPRCSLFLMRHETFQWPPVLSALTWILGHQKVDLWAAVIVHPLKSLIMKRFTQPSHCLCTPGICICFLSKNCSGDSLSQVAGQIPFCTPTESAFEASKQTNFVLWPPFLFLKQENWNF